ncbi:MAG: hypothetical protein PHT57_15505 [Rhodoferax sp.]|nr:hypothetical protein [Rhodoferax sp.]
MALALAGKARAAMKIRVKIQYPVSASGARRVCAVLAGPLRVTSGAHLARCLLQTLYGEQPCRVFLNSFSGAFEMTQQNRNEQNEQNRNAQNQTGQNQNQNQQNQNQQKQNEQNQNNQKQNNQKQNEQNRN